MKICVVGLGYVGLPLLLALDKEFSVIGLDSSKDRIDSLRRNIDMTSEATQLELSNYSGVYTHESDNIGDANVYIVTVPTPIDENNNPDLKYIISATKSVANALKSGDLIVFESTVYPGCTEEICIPILEQYSGLILNEDFSVGYSPERISPGKNGKRLAEIVKVVSASNKLALEQVSHIYSKIIDAGIFKATSIKAAEASKVIENTQRDLNIALMNEFSLILDALDMHWSEVLPAAYTKWNFNRYHPGLVGGHCIGVDPYYLAHKANTIGVDANLILAGRSLNEEYPKKLARKFVKHKLSSSQNDTMTVIAGATFKPDCDDTRNSKVEIFAKELQEYNIKFKIFDPYSSQRETEVFKYKIENEIYINSEIDLIVLVPHTDFKSNLKQNSYKTFMGCKIKQLFSLTPIDECGFEILL